MADKSKQFKERPVIIQVDIPEYLLSALQERFERGETTLPQATTTRSELIAHVIAAYLGVAPVKKER